MLKFCRWISRYLIGPPRACTSSGLAALRVTSFCYAFAFCSVLIWPFGRREWQHGAPAPGQELLSRSSVISWPSVP